ncbi:MAG: hypothetical protein MHM6MM_002787 [Cercozoa sp. M6MM]
MDGHSDTAKESNDSVDTTDEEEDDGEVDFVFFKPPTYRSCLLIFDLPGSVIEEDLRAVFSKYGLLFSVVLKTDSKGRPYAFIKFYSRRHALRAKQNYRGHRVQWSRPSINVEMDGRGELSSSQCVELADQAGFSSWSSQVTACHEEKALAEQPRLTSFLAQVKLTIKGDSRFGTYDTTVLGTGRGVSLHHNRPDAFRQAKHAAVTNAYRSAFNEVVLAVPPEGEPVLLAWQEFLNPPSDDDKRFEELTIHVDARDIIYKELYTSFVRDGSGWSRGQ